ncbi:uncharacterized protein METZ01_LOCUS303601, partial [marine metagenome]
MIFLVGFFFAGLFGTSGSSNDFSSDGVNGMFS